MKTLHTDIGQQQPLWSRIYNALFRTGYWLGSYRTAAANALDNALAWLAWRIWGPLFTRAWQKGIRLDGHCPANQLFARHSNTPVKTAMADLVPSRRKWRNRVP